MNKFEYKVSYPGTGTKYYVKKFTVPSGKSVGKAMSFPNEPTAIRAAARMNASSLNTRLV